MSDIAVHTHVTKSTSGNRPAASSNDSGSTKGMDFLDLITKLTSQKVASDNSYATDKAQEAADKVLADQIATMTLGTKIAATDAKLDAKIKADALAAAAQAQTQANTTGTEVIETDIDPATLSSLDDETAGIILDLSANDDATTTLDAAGLKTLKAALDNLLHGIPAGQKPVTVKLTVAQLQKIVQDLKANAGDLQDGQEALIATGLSPEQLTKLSNMIAQGDLENIDDDNAGLKAILVGILKLVPDGEGTKTVFFPKTLMLAKDDTDAVKIKDEDKKDEVSSSLTALFAVPAAPMDTSAVKAGGLDSGAIAPEKKGAGGFNEVLKILENLQANMAQGAGGHEASDKLAAAGTQTPAPQAGPVNSTTGESFANLFGDLSSDGSLSDTFPEGLDWSKGNQYGLSSMQASGTASVTSLVTQASSATQSHPATQVVAAVIAKSMGSGETKNILLRLDPPELGKIEIQMHFTKDKSVKTHMIFEKPETMLMMQRDQSALERAMQSAGMENNNGLSFELASHDHAFNGGQGNNDNSGSGRNGSSGAVEPQLIETTMSWSVDGETGQYHYNVIV